VISIIVVTKNNKSTIKSVLESTKKFAEKYKTELIVVDGKSQDGTYETARKFLETYSSLFVRTALLQDPGISLSYARHIGYTHSKGDIVIFLDGDTILSNTFIEKFETVMRRDYDVIIPSFTILSIDKATRIFNYTFNIIERTSVNLKKSSIIQPARIFTRRILEQLHGYPPLSRYFGEDRVATSLAMLKTSKIAYMPELKIIKIDDPTLAAYIKKHVRYGKGIRRDLTPTAKQLLRDYIIARRATYINLVLPAISAIYAAYTFHAFRNILISLQVFAMKYIIDISMLMGELISALADGK